MRERTLVICEKPVAARRIAQALDESGTPEERQLKGAPYFLARREGEVLVIVSALGHLFSIAQDGGTWSYPVYNYKWAPIHETDKKASRNRDFIEAIVALSGDVERYVSACDYDMEGSLIAYMILLHVCGGESVSTARRMRYSTLTPEDIVKAWETMPPSLDLPLIEAGRSRHEIDWLFGINLSRALTLSVKNATGFYKTLSMGRVQGPTLGFIKEREIEIRAFVPTPYWVIKAETRIGRKRYRLEYSRPRIDTAREADEIVKACQGKRRTISSIEERQREQPPWPPFSLGDLQREAYYKLRYSPRTTLRAAEELYLKALISYPRTSSQRLPPSIDLRGILRGLRKRREYAELAEALLSQLSLRPRQGKRDDPAHPAVHPTGRMPGSLGRVEARVYDLICRRFMASMAGPSRWLDVDASLDVEGHRFHLKGSTLVERGWIAFYEPYVKKREGELPPLKEGQTLPISRIEAPRNMTKPPARFNPGSLLSLMERENIGTKATRTDVMDTLVKRGYVRGGRFEITDLGLSIVETLETYCPEILSVALTREMEEDLEAIQASDISGKAVVGKAVDVLRPILAEFKSVEGEIGLELDKAIRSEAVRASVLGPCPGCGAGEIRLIESRRTGKRFAGCTNYRNGSCEKSYPLPQRGGIKATGRSCPACGAPVVNVVRRGRRPWTLCLDPDCPTKRRNEAGEKM